MGHYDETGKGDGRLWLTPISLMKIANLTESGRRFQEINRRRNE
jgi:hypothetical protein